MKKVLIKGGGMTAAGCLLQAGFEVEAFERVRSGERGTT